MSQKGLTPILIVLILAALIGGYVLYSRQKSSTPSSLQPFDSAQGKPTPQTSSSAEMANWKTYTNIPNGFSIKYPSEWNVKENTYNKSDLPKFSVTIMPPSKPDIEFPPIIGVRVYDNSSSLTLENFVKKQNPFSFQSTTVVVSGVGGIKISLPGATNNDHIFLAFNKNIYDISLDHSVKKEDDINSETFNQILSTFKFTQ